MPYPKLKDAFQKFNNALNDFSCSGQKMISDALRLASAVHNGQKKFGLYYYIIHPLSVFNFIFYDLHIKKPQLLIAALLHDVVEDSDGGISFDRIEKYFGAEVYKIVKTVTRIAGPNETEEDKKNLKMQFFKEVVCKGCWDAKILGIADKYDNIKNALLIPCVSPHYKKIPRWIEEAGAFLEMAKKTNKKAYSMLNEALQKLKKMEDEQCKKS